MPIAIVILLVILFAVGLVVDIIQRRSGISLILLILLIASFLFWLIISTNIAR